MPLNLTQQLSALEIKNEKLLELLWTELCSSVIHVEALTPNVTVPEITPFEEVIQAKLDFKGKGGTLNKYD